MLRHEVLSAVRDYLRVKHQGHMELLATLPQVKADLEALERESWQERRLRLRREAEDKPPKKRVKVTVILS